MLLKQLNSAELRMERAYAAGDEEAGGAYVLCVVGAGLGVGLGFGWATACAGAGVAARVGLGVTFGFGEGVGAEIRTTSDFSGYFSRKGSS
jgi:hypothetical protein